MTAHPGLSASSATNLLVDEALRTQEHPQVVFRDGPAGRRARLVAGPDVWEVARALRNARAAEPDLAAEALVQLVSETSGVEAGLIRAAINYWTAFPDEVDAWIDRADIETAEAESRWRREQALFAR